MKILIVHAIERNTLQLLIDAGKKANHYVKACNMKKIEIYDGKIYCDQEDIATFDIALFREVRDNTDEEKMITAYLNDHKIPIIDTRIRDGKGGSKINTYLSLSKAGVPFPETMFFPSIQNKKFSFVSTRVGIPFITKIINGQQGKGVYLIHNESEFDDLKAHTTHEKFLFQRFIENDGDIRVFILGDTILGSIKRKGQEGEFRNNVALGGSAQHVDISQEIGDMALKATKALGLQIAGVDVIVDKKSGKPYILEVNRSPEFEGFMEATGINVAHHIISFLEQTAMK
ncbi:MAG TPA: RimK family alpha-L-glutamate ligase [Candidatus Absconditabacterales bacterium]|nr:RimK family alpha-L-glutamate ligase [Candidatus Absconditabacterales bacterium]